jgi:hypothetical protein
MAHIKLYQMVIRMILNNILNLIKITEDNIFVQAKNYGISGVVDNWLTKLFSPNITDNFDALINSVDSAAKIFKIDVIQQKDNEEILNRAIHKCKENDGKCIINIFYDTINTMTTLIIDRYIDLLIHFKVPVLDSISTFQDLAKLDLKKYDQLTQFDKAIHSIYQNYNDSLNQENFNKFFFKMRGSVIDAPFIKNKMNFLDNYIVTVINNKLGKRFSVTSR